MRRPLLTLALALLAALALAAPAQAAFSPKDPELTSSLPEGGIQIVKPKAPVQITQVKNFIGGSPPPAPQCSAPALGSPGSRQGPSCGQEIALALLSLAASFPLTSAEARLLMAFALLFAALALVPPSSAPSPRRPGQRRTRR